MWWFMSYEVMILKWNKETSHAVVMQWHSEIFATLKLLEPIGKFRADNYVLFNSKTLEIELIKNKIKVFETDAE